MPVYNGEQYLQESVDSILSQSFTDFEFLIIDDGSTDNSVALVRSYTDSRIRLVLNGINLGLVETLNKGLRLANGHVVARMDCDDICHPERLATQWSFMEKNNDVVVCGTWIKNFGLKRFTIKFPQTNNEIRANLLFDNVLAHPTVMIRKKELFYNNLFYDSNYTRAEDYELWTRIPNTFKLANINKVLLSYRQHNKQISEKFYSTQLSVTNSIKKKQLEFLGIKVDTESLNLHEKISQQNPEPSTMFLKKAASWLLTIQEKNLQTGIYDRDALSWATGSYWWKTCFHSTELGINAWNAYFDSRLNFFRKPNNINFIIFGIKCLLKKKKKQPLPLQPA